MTTRRVVLTPASEIAPRARGQSKTLTPETIRRLVSSASAAMEGDTDG